MGKVADARGSLTLIGRELVVVFTDGDVCAPGTSPVMFIREVLDMLAEPTSAAKLQRTADTLSSPSYFGLDTALTTSELKDLAVKLSAG